jgi:hypothetical protein
VTHDKSIARNYMRVEACCQSRIDHPFEFAHQAPEPAHVDRSLGRVGADASYAIRLASLPGSSGANITLIIVHLGHIRSIKHVVELDDVCIAGRALEHISRAVEA